MIGFAGQIRYQTDKPDGTPVKRLDMLKLDGLGWTATSGLEEGVEQIYA